MTWLPGRPGPRNVAMSDATAIVTGATSGIGEAVARRLAAEGFHVVAGGRDPGKGDTVVAEIRAAGGKADFVAADLGGSYEGLRAFAAEAVQALGGRVDVLVNNAGIYPVSETAALPDADLDAMLAVNVRAPHVLVGEIAPLMVVRGRGAIVTIGSWMASVGSAFGAMYTATKAADEQLTRSWAAEFGPRGVRVNAVAPGVTATPGNAHAREITAWMAAQTPARVPVQPDDIAHAVAFLVSDEARMIHGTTLYVDGGITTTRIAQG
jgi:NAD(P)-dependent dehydrogenase (short-subunit alcohol dehydrogenase family)